MVERNCPADSIEYTIKPGDTLYNLAQEYNTTVDAIIQANPDLDLDPQNLQIGQKICMPTLRH